MRKFLVFLLCCMLWAIQLVPSSAIAQTKLEDDCKQIVTIDPVEVKGKTPILFVHGMLSDPGIGASLIHALNNVKGVITANFNYQQYNQNWVTHPEIAPKLAKTIVCYGELSKHKDVIVVAHSMGGLATELAASMEFDGKKVRSYLKYVITIGTPFWGSELAGLATTVGGAICKAPATLLSPLMLLVRTPEQCLQGFAIKALSPESPELAAIPSFPASVAVKTIAGDVSIKMWTPWGDYNDDTQSDLQVPLASAQARYTRLHDWDGTKVFTCSGSVMIPGHSDAPCEHVGLMRLPEVHEEVKTGIEKYLKAADAPPKPSAPPGRTTTILGKLTITYPTVWGKGVNQPGLEDAVDYSNCPSKSMFECPHINFVDMNSEIGRTYGADPQKITFDCYLEQDENGHKPYELPKLKSLWPVGNEPADYYEEKVCPPSLSHQTAVIWHVKNRHVLILSEGETLGHKVSIPTLTAVLANAVWK